MKKQIIIATLALGAFVVGSNNVNAQVSAETKVNIILANVLSIETPATEVTFTYDSALAYNTTQAHTVVGNLKVTSTTLFDIDVKAADLNFTDGINNIPVSVLSINPVVLGGTTTMTGTRSNIVELSTSDQKLITGAALGSELLLDIEYEILGSKSASADILGKAVGTYTQQVIYTATAM